MREDWTVTVSQTLMTIASNGESEQPTHGNSRRRCEAVSSSGGSAGKRRRTRRPKANGKKAAMPDRNKTPDKGDSGR